jgi:hypothetical protein
MTGERVGRTLYLLDIKSRSHWESQQSLACASYISPGLAKWPRCPSGHRLLPSADSGQLIHLDICGPMEKATPGGALYLALFIDDYIGMRFIYLIRKKSEAAGSFMELIHVIRGETGNLVPTLRTDNGGEYGSNEFQNWLTRKARDQCTTHASARRCIREGNTDSNRRSPQLPPRLPNTFGTMGGSSHHRNDDPHKRKPPTNQPVGRSGQIHGVHTKPRP